MFAVCLALIWFCRLQWLQAVNALKGYWPTCKIAIALAVITVAIIFVTKQLTKQKKRLFWAITITGVYKITPLLATGAWRPFQKTQIQQAVTKDKDHKDKKKK